MKIRFTALLVICFCVFLNAQEGNDDVKEISEEACDCIAQIDLNLEKLEANNKIQSCISEAIISNQINLDLMGKLTKAVDSINSSETVIDSLVVNDNKEIVISVDKGYEEIEEYLLRNCQQLKILVTSDNTEYQNSHSDHDKAIKFYNEGIDFYKVGNYKKALPKFKKAVKADKTFAFAWDNLGLCQRKTGKFKDAIKSYNESLKLDPQGKMPLMNIPVAYESLKDYDNAILAYKRFSEMYPDDPEGYYGIGRMYHVKGNYEEALESTFKAYIIYKDMQSPYVQDTERNISIFYNEMEEKGMLKMFNKIAEKYNIKTNK